MRLRFFLLAVWFGIFMLPGAVYAQPSTILILGDSLSSAYNLEVEKGWVSLLQQRLDQEGYGALLVNASITGETTRGGVKRLPRLLKKHQPRVVVIELGSNDGLRGFPLKVLTKNLTRMIELSQAAGAQVILAGNRLPPNYSEAYTEVFYKVFGIVAEDTGSALIDFFLQDIVTDESLLLDDRIHPNHKAQPILRDRVYDKLIPLLRDQKS